MSWAAPIAARLQGDRLHLQHGPIDLVIGAEGASADVALSYEAAKERFRFVLDELVAELVLLRQPLSGDKPPLAASPIARRMIAACWPHRSAFITPMAAVAGSVADEIKATMLAAAPRLQTLYVNNGGDIAVQAAEGSVLRVGLVPDLARAAPEGVITIDHSSGIGGIATSGWRGRSFSLGIADAATVVAADAADADAAATIIANAVDVADAAVMRASAHSLDPDSDLGDRLVTTGVGPLSSMLLEHALGGGEAEAARLLRAGTIIGAAITLQGRWRIVGAGAGLLPIMA